MYAHLADYTVMDDGREDPYASQPWFWSLTVFGAHLAGAKPSGRAATLEAAKEAFQTNYKQWLAWAKLEEPS